jgi:hypothetical protein
VVTAQQRQVPRPIARGTSSISGHVIDSISKGPVAGCTLRVVGSGNFNTLMSDPDGAYELKNVAADNYYFFVQCPAHLALCIGPANPDNQNCLLVELARDQERKDVNFHMVPGAIARGQVMALDGQPIAQAKVRLGRGMHGEPTSSNTAATTDEEGRFELTNLPAGEWRLEVEIPPVAGGLPPPTVYYPGGLSWEEAGGVTLAAGTITDRLTITVPRINENTLTIFVPPADATISDIAVSVLQESPMLTRTIELNAEGVGSLTGVLPGRYFVIGRAASRDKKWAAYEVVDFIEDTYEARLQLMPTGSIAGKIVTEKGDPPPVGGVMIGASWIHDGAEVDPINADEVPVAVDGSFRIDNLFGTRLLRPRALGVEWEVAAIRQGRTDVTTSGVVIAPDTTTEATIVLRRR